MAHELTISSRLESSWNFRTLELDPLLLRGNTSQLHQHQYRKPNFGQTVTRGLIPASDPSALLIILKFDSCSHLARRYIIFTVPMTTLPEPVADGIRCLAIILTKNLSRISLCHGNTSHQ